MEDKIVLELTKEQAEAVYGQIKKDEEFFDPDSDFCTHLETVLKLLENKGITW